MDKKNTEHKLNHIYEQTKTYIIKNKLTVIMLSGIYITYIIMNYLILLFRYISTPIIFTIMLIKLGLCSISENPDTIYIEAILRQTFVVMILQLSITLLNIIDTIPIINIFSIFNYISFSLIILSYLVIIPIGITNTVFKKLSSKLCFLNKDKLLTVPLADTIFKLINSYIPYDSYIVSNLKNVMINYDNKNINNINIKQISDIITVLNNNTYLIEKCNIDNIIYVYGEAKHNIVNIIRYIINVIK